MTTDAKAIKEMEKINEQNDTGVALSELQPEGVVYGEPVGSKDSNKGRTGVLGEAGPEAIMPLSRGADGKLGIASESAGVLTTETDYPAAQKPTTKK